MGSLKKYNVCIVALIVTAVVAMSIAIIRINLIYPQVQVLDIACNAKGEWTDGVFMTINSTELYSSQEALRKYEEISFEFADGVDFKVLEISASIENTNVNPKVIYLYDLYIETDVYANGVAGEFQLLSDTTKLDIDILPNEKRNVTLCYVVYENQFSKRDWSEMSAKDFGLVGTSYPIKRRWSIG